MVLDAGQFYEAHQTREASDALQRLVDIATEKSGETTVTVIRGRRVHGHLGGKTTPFPPHWPKCAVCSFRELVRFFRLTLRLGTVRIGDSIW